MTFDPYFITKASITISSTLVPLSSTLSINQTFNKIQNLVSYQEGFSITTIPKQESEIAFPNFNSEDSKFGPSFGDFSVENGKANSRISPFSDGLTSDKEFLLQMTLAYYAFCEKSCDKKLTGLYLHNFYNNVNIMIDKR